MSWKWAIWGLLPINSCRVGPADLSIKTCTNVLWGGKKYIILLIHCQDAYRAHMCTQQRFERLFTTSFFLTWKHLALIFLVYICWVTKGLPKDNGLHACGHGCFVSKQSLEHCWTCWWVIPYPSRRAAARWSERVEGIRFPWMRKDEAGNNMWVIGSQIPCHTLYRPQSFEQIYS